MSRRFFCSSVSVKSTIASSCLLGRQIGVDSRVNFVGGRVLRHPARTQITTAMPAAIARKVTKASSQLICLRLPRVRRHMRQNPGVEEAFAYVLFGTVLIAAIVALLSLRGARYDHIGRGGLFEDEPQRRPEPAPVAAAIRDEEIRQLVD